jgi:hypothetical protein
LKTSLCRREGREAARPALERVSTASRASCMSWNLVSGFRVYGLGFMVWGLWSRVSGLGFGALRFRHLDQSPLPRHTNFAQVHTIPQPSHEAHKLRPHTSFRAIPDTPHLILAVTDPPPCVEFSRSMSPRLMVSRRRITRRPEMTCASAFWCVRGVSFEGLGFGF